MHPGATAPEQIDIYTLVNQANSLVSLDTVSPERSNAVTHETKENSLQKSPTNSSLAQLAEYKTDDKKVMGSKPTGGNF